MDALWVGMGISENLQGFLKRCDLYTANAKLWSLESELTNKRILDT